IHGEYAAEMVRQAMAERYPDEVYSRGFRVYTTVRRADQEAAYVALRRGVLDYDRRSGYRRPEGYAELPASPGDDDFEEALGVHLARCAGRRGARAGGRLRLRPQQVQSRDPGVAPARLIVQAVHLFGVAGEGLHARHRHRRRAGGAGGRADRKPALGAEKLR